MSHNKTHNWLQHLLYKNPYANFSEISSVNNFNSWRALHQLVKKKQNNLELFSEQQRVTQTETKVILEGLLRSSSLYPTNTASEYQQLYCHKVYKLTTKFLEEIKVINLEARQKDFDALKKASMKLKERIQSSRKEAGTSAGDLENLSAKIKSVIANETFKSAEFYKKKQEIRAQRQQNQSGNPNRPDPENNAWNTAKRTVINNNNNNNKYKKSYPKPRGNYRRKNKHNNNNRQWHRNNNNNNNNNNRQTYNNRNNNRYNNKYNNNKNNHRYKNQGRNNNNYNKNQKNNNAPYKNSNYKGNNWLPYHLRHKRRSFHNSYRNNNNNNRYKNNRYRNNRYKRNQNRNNSGNNSDSYQLGFHFTDWGNLPPENLNNMQS